MRGAGSAVRPVGNEVQVMKSIRNQRRLFWLVAPLATLFFVLAAVSQERPAREHKQRSDSLRTMKPLVMGKHYAVTSMMSQATVAAERILEKGGNAFDAAVGGQAVLGLVSPAANGVGSDAMLLAFDAKADK